MDVIPSLVNHILLRFYIYLCAFPTFPLSKNIYPPPPPKKALLFLLSSPSSPFPLLFPLPLPPCFVPTLSPPPTVSFTTSLIVFLERQKSMWALNDASSGA